MLKFKIIISFLFVLCFTELNATNLKVLTSGSETYGLEGIKTNKFNGNDPYLYATEYTGNRILILNKNSGQVIRVIDDNITVNDDNPNTPENLNLFHMDDIAIGPDGSLYVTSVDGRWILKVKPDNTLEAVAFIDGSGGSNSIEFSNDGTRLFIGQCFSGSGRLFEVENLSPTKEEVNAGNLRLISDSLGAGAFISCSLNSFDVRASDGMLYGGRFGLGDIVKVDPDTGNYEVIVSELNSPEEEKLVFPTAVKFDSSGRLYILEAGKQRLLRYIEDSSGEWHFDKIFLDEQLVNADNMAFDSDDNLYITGSTAGYVRKLFPNEQGISLVKQGITAPYGIALVGNTIYLNEFKGIRKVNKKTGKLLEFTQGGTQLLNPTERLYFAQNMKNCDDNTIIISEWAIAEAQVLNADLDPIDFAWFLFSDIGYWAYNTGEICDSSGGLYFADFALGIVARVDRNSGQLTDFYFPGGHPGDLAIAPDGTLYAADYVSGTIYNVFNNSTVISGLNNPETINFDTDGKLLVMEVGEKRLISVDTQSGEFTVVAGDLPIGDPPSSQFLIDYGFPARELLASFVVDKQTNSIYFVSDVNRSLYEIKR